MRRSKQELRDRWLARAAAPSETDQVLRDELNLRKTRRGPPLGNKNRLTHGLYTGERLAFDAKTRALVTLSKVLEALHSLPPRSPQKNELAQRLGDKLNSTFGVCAK